MNGRDAGQGYRLRCIDVEVRHIGNRIERRRRIYRERNEPAHFR